MARKRNRSWTADTLCRLDTDCACMGDSETLIPNSDGPGEDVIPFLPRFLLQGTIFAQSPLDDLYPHRGIFCAGRTGFVCEELQRRNARSNRFEKSSPILRAARANFPAQGRGTSERIQVVARTDAMVWKVQAESTALALGEQTVPTTQNQTSGSGTWGYGWRRPPHVPEPSLQPHIPFHGSFSVRASLVHLSVEVPPNPTGSP